MDSLRMTDLEWWIYEGQDVYRIEPNAPHYKDATGVWLIQNRKPGHRFVAEYSSVEEAVKAARNSGE